MVFNYKPPLDVQEIVRQAGFAVNQDYLATATSVLTSGISDGPRDPGNEPERSRLFRRLGASAVHLRAGTDGLST